MSIRISFAALACVAFLALPQQTFAQANIGSEPLAQTGQDTPEASGIHNALEWAQTRLAEIDATIAALEVDADRLGGDLRSRADETLADLRLTRDAYRAEIEAALEAASQSVQARTDETLATLESQWATFENDVQGYLDATETEAESRRVVMIARIEAQRAALEDSIAELRESAERLADEQRMNIESQINAMEALLAQGQGRLSDLEKTGKESWVILKQGLDDVRSVFTDTYDRINETIMGAEEEK